jgi:hypothetical protein
MNDNFNELREELKLAQTEEDVWQIGDKFLKFNNLERLDPSMIGYEEIRYKNKFQRLFLEELDHCLCDIHKRELRKIFFPKKTTLERS